MPFIVQSSGLDGELTDTNILEEDLAASYCLKHHTSNLGFLSVIVGTSVCCNRFCLMSDRYTGQNSEVVLLSNFANFFILFLDAS
jgi:hypothetical protein